MIVHTVGDSHALHGWQDIKGIQIHHLGAKLMYTFGNEKRNLVDIKKLNIPDRSIVVF
jgi:membrane carboxypeptidase/penicillin-binding protein